MSTPLYILSPANAALPAAMRAGIPVIHCGSVGDLLDKLADTDGVALVDLRTAGGLDAARRIRSESPGTPVLGIADSGAVPQDQPSEDRGLLVETLTPPVNAGELAAALARLHNGSSEASVLPHRCPASQWGLFGRSPRMRTLISQVVEAGARFDGVVVSGEPGTGRGLVARAVHECGVTKGKPFVAVYCREIPPAQAEATLFGTPQPRPFLRSSHHGEVVMSGSLVHQAIGGTLYFRNVEELPDRIQARLARVFRDREVLVDTHAHPVALDTRPVAAAGADYQDHLSEGRVRLDLHRRLSNSTLEVPPLRDRAEDIPLLAEHFVDKACQAARVPSKRLETPSHALLRAMPWRGNARELQGLMGSAVMAVPGPQIGLDDVLGLLHLEAAAKSPFEASAFEATTLRDAKARFEREYILAVLAQHHGRIPEAARVLGIQRTNLYRKLRALRIRREVQTSRHPVPQV